jgi:predicted MPP superfamily phosphohydrolase
MSPVDSGPAARAAGPGLRQPQRRHSLLRRATFAAIAHGSAALGGRAVYRRAWLAAGRFRVREEVVRVPGLPAGLVGFRIAQLSDLHAGPFLGAGDLAQVAAAVRALAPDLAVITGDLITSRWSQALQLLDDLAALGARHGTLAVFGNHDYRERREGEIAAAYAARGVVFLRDACHRIDTGDGVLGVVGLEDLEEARELDLERARAGLEPGDVELVLCHNPSGAAALARPGCCAVLSGHTHGGQVRFLSGLGPPHPGLRVRLGPTTLIVNRGLGVVGFPWRVGAPTEIVLVRLEPG